MSTSAGVMPASANAFGPLTAAAVRVMSAIALIEWCVLPPAAPRTYTGRCARSRARSSVVRMRQQPPSEITQQSSLCSGSATSFDDSTSSTVIGSRYIAFGLRVACSRVCTAIDASCSGLVPYSCMWRCAAIAYAPTSVSPVGNSYDIASGSAIPPPRPPPPPVPSVRPERRQLVVAVDDRDRVGVAVLDRPVRVHRVELEARAADARRLHPARLHARGTRRARPRACRRSPRSRARRSPTSRARRRRAPAGTPAPRASCWTARA